MRISMGAWLLAMAVSAASASAAELAARGDPARALIALDEKWVAALQRSDTKTLSALWAQTYVDTDETGHRSDKAEVLRILKSGALKPIRPVRAARRGRQGHAGVADRSGVDLALVANRCAVSIVPGVRQHDRLRG
jgi:hypothetical protein